MNPPYLRSRRRPPVDTVLAVTTPEGCTLTLRLAGPVARSRAFLIDAVIRVVLFLVASMALAFTGAFGKGLAAILFFSLEWLYPTLFEAFRQGATPGKRFCGLAVVRDDGTPAGFDGAAIRNLLRFVDALPIGYAVGIVAMGLDRHGRRLGDLLAGTVVIYSNGAAAPSAVTHEYAGEPPPFNLTAQEQRAILEFRQRAGSLTEERLDELAALAVPLTAGDSPAEGRKRLFRIADYLLGRDGIRSSAARNGASLRAGPNETG